MVLGSFPILTWLVNRDTRSREHARCGAQREGVCHTWGTTGGRTQWKGINGSHQKQVVGRHTELLCKSSAGTNGAKVQAKPEKRSYFHSNEAPTPSLEGHLQEPLENVSSPHQPSHCLVVG